MKKKKKKLSMSLSVLIIGFLISSSSLNTISTQALLDTNEDQYNIDPFDKSAWKWSTTEVVSTESTGDSRYSSLAVDSAENVHIAWYDFTNYLGSGTDADIFYKRWNASTSIWTTTEVVSTESTSYSYFPSLAVDTLGNVHIAWHDLTNYAGSGTDWDIFYKCWNTSTSIWTTTEVVSTESTGDSLVPSLATDAAGNVHIAWHDYTDYAGSGTDVDIFYKRWNASTSIWTTTEVVSTESTGGSYNPSLATDAAGNVHIAWHDYTDYAGSGTDADIFYKCWNTSTSIWTMTEVVSTESAEDSYFPSLATDAAGNVHIAWHDYTDYAGSGTDVDIFYKRWDASTSIWTTTEVMSTESTDWSYYPSLATDAAGNVHIAWHDYTDYAGNGTDWDIFYKRWNASTSIWTTTEVVSTESSGHSYIPSLVTDAEGDVHIAWYDYTNYLGSGIDTDIFYKGTTKVDFSSPLITDVTYIPSEPTFDDQITISANVTDNVEVHNVTLYFYIDGGSWFSVSMVASETTYSAIIGPFAAGSTIDYYIIAFDTSGNIAQSSTMNFEIAIVIEEFGIISSLILSTLAITVVIMKIRKKKSKPN